MLTIKIGNKKIKPFNWLIFILLVLFIIYLIGCLFFMLPFFKKTYEYNFNGGNYKINANVTFKNNWLSCNTKEEFKIDANNKYLNELIEKDLLEDGFIKNKDKYIRTIKNHGTCSNKTKYYKKIHSNNYVYFKLNGNSNQKLLFGNKFNDEYVTIKINNKSIKEVNKITNLNENKLGKYFIKYEVNVSDTYKVRLYRLVNIVDEQKPALTLNGDKNITINYLSKYNEPGYKAVDNYDGDITDKVTVKENVNTKKPGTYKINYKVSDSSGNYTTEKRIVVVNETKNTSTIKPDIKVKDGITYVNGILIVNKTYSLPKNYDPKVNKEALSALKNMQADASALGLDLTLVSAYRSYNTQKQLYNKYVKKDGEKKASTYSALPGHSEHQTGLAFDIGRVDSSFENTNEAKWIDKNAYLYGFIVRYPKDKMEVTGYIYEPWHVRYLGIDIAKKVKQSGLTLEEYLGIN